MNPKMKTKCITERSRNIAEKCATDYIRQMKPIWKTSCGGAVIHLENLCAGMLVHLIERDHAPRDPAHETVDYFRSEVVRRMPKKVLKEYTRQTIAL